jgi:hypothetical protein
MPATEAPVPNGLGFDAMPPAIDQRQAIAKPTTDEQELQQLRTAMGQMVAAFPASAEGEVLRNKFADLHRQLQGAENLEVANNILDEGFEVIKEKINASPNADELIDLMYQMREAQLERLQVFAPTIPGLKTGWLS